MKILLVTMLYDYGDPKRGYSYEYYNLYDSLRQLHPDTQIYDYMTKISELGRNRMNEDLITFIRENKFDLAVFSLYKDQFIPETITEIRKYTKTLCFFHDDTWRRDFSRYWAQYFDYFTTTDIYGEARYPKLGLPNAIYFPWGANPNIYKKLDMPKIYDVSFVGGYHPYREWLIKLLIKNGIKVDTFGHRWPNGMIEQDSMIQVFNQSKINLNLSNSSSWDMRYLLSNPKAVINTIRSKKNSEQMKARHFEINGCSGFQLSYYVEGLEHNYEIGKEIAIFNSPDELLEKVQYFLTNDDEREAIAQAGYERTMAEHTFPHRFKCAFKKMGGQ